LRRMITNLNDETWNWKTKRFHWQNDDYLFNYVRKTCPDIKWPDTMATTNDRGWGSEYIKTQFKRFEENTEEFKSAYVNHKIQKFFPL